jgi:hypothetical protein
MTLCLGLGRIVKFERQANVDGYICNQYAELLPYAHMSIARCEVTQYIHLNVVPMYLTINNGRQISELSGRIL